MIAEPVIRRPTQRQRHVRCERHRDCGAVRRFSGTLDGFSRTQLGVGDNLPALSASRCPHVWSQRGRAVQQSGVGAVPLLSPFTADWAPGNPPRLLDRTATRIHPPDCRLGYGLGDAKTIEIGGDWHAWPHFCCLTVTPGSSIKNGRRCLSARKRLISACGLCKRTHLGQVAAFVRRCPTIPLLKKAC